MGPVMGALPLPNATKADPYPDSFSNFFPARSPAGRLISPPHFSRLRAARMYNAPTYGLAFLSPGRGRLGRQRGPSGPTLGSRRTAPDAAHAGHDPDRDVLPHDPAAEQGSQGARPDDRRPQEERPRGHGRRHLRSDQASQAGRPRSHLM